MAIKNHGNLCTKIAPREFSPEKQGFYEEAINMNYNYLKNKRNYAVYFLGNLSSRAGFWALCWFSEVLSQDLSTVSVDNVRRGIAGVTEIARVSPLKHLML